MSTKYTSYFMPTKFVLNLNNFVLSSNKKISYISFMSFWNEYILKLKELEKLGASIFCIGKSVLNRPIFCVKIGDGKKKILVQYAIHAREHITFHLSFLQAKSLLKEKQPFSIFLIPLANPDGVCLAVDGLKSVDEANLDTNIKAHFSFLQQSVPLSSFYLKKIKSELIKINKSQDFSLWKANILGVDLNVNFDAKWGTGKTNVFTPSSANFVGKFPESEPETKALANFTRAIRPHMTISYHSKGEVIFYKFGQRGKTLKKDKLIAQEISKETGYKISYARGSVGGFKDWCVQDLHIPSLTIEVGNNNLPHPLDKKELIKIYQQNKNVILKSLALL